MREADADQRDQGILPRPEGNRHPRTAALEEEAAVALNPGTNSGTNPGTIPALAVARIAAHGGETILRKKYRGIWNAVTWSDLGARIDEVVAGLQAMGFRSGDIACLLAETRLEWVYVDLGILSAGGVSGGINPADEPEQLGEALQQSGCRVLFVENEEQLDKVLLVREAC